MSPRFKGQWRPSLFKLMLMIVLLPQVGRYEATATRGPIEQQQQFSQPLDADPMEPCYLANNRASESLTISESTPVGTVVGEIMVNGDSSINGNIELSIKMPGGNSQLALAGSKTSRQAVDTQRQQKQQTNGYSSLSSLAIKRIGSPPMETPVSDKHASGGRMTGATAASKSARNLSNLIDLMPPLSIEYETKRLILAKKLDRENLDRYIVAGAYQSSSTLNSLAQSSSSASLTVHIKCQLRPDNQVTSRLPLESTSNETFVNNNSTLVTMTKKISQQRQNSNPNSILIPIHIIVTDENDNWPVFINSPYIIDLNETVQVGSLLPGNEIVAIDNDQQGPLSTIEYSIVAGSLWSESFGFLNPLDSRSLIVKDNRLLDYEGQSKLMLKVMARDQGEPPNWAITSLYINLFDNDDLSPIFSEDKYYGYVKQNMPGEIIDVMPKRLLARDGDKTMNSAIVYSFHLKTKHSIHFDLDPDLGKLSLKKTLPEEQANTRHPFCLLIKASQVEDPNQSTLTIINMRLSKSLGSDLASTQQLERLLIGGYQPVGHLKATNSESSISYSDDSLELFRFPKPNFTIEVSESAPVGFTVLNLRVSYNKQAFLDEWHDVDRVTTYQLLDDELGYFNLDERSGKLTLNKSLDYELYRHLSVRILAMTNEYHDNHEPLTTTPLVPNLISNSNSNNYPKLVCDITRVNINIINQNDHKPEFSHEQYNFQLSVSDLIANFDLPKVHNINEQMEDSIETIESSIRHLSNKHSTIEPKSLTKRFGELELDEGPIEIQDHYLGWRAIQLGQVYCADRDFGDKVSLKLLGSKANLFYLSQDGRFYLPLVNISSLSTSQTAGIRRSDVWSSLSWWSSQPRTINNQFAQSRLFSSRRNENQHEQEQQQEDHVTDRKYLNYLLGEFSNLGRLRLKVIATDNGQPQSYQSTALIVITIISIDNFILQLAPQLPNGSNNNFTLDNAAIQLTSETSYDSTSRLDLDRENKSSSHFINQVMMIPATNGRSFVQINPDIIGSLISQSTYQQEGDFNSTGRGDPLLYLKPVSNTTSSSSGNSSSSSSSSNDTSKSGLDSLQSSIVIGARDSAVLHSATQGTGFRSFQPPSLLLVDDDGAKFVAMPAAMQVYNQQVQEAADQALQKIHTPSSIDLAKRANGQENSFWHQWRGHFKYSNVFGSNQSNGPFYWINLSTVLILHLITLVIVVILVTKIRSSLHSSNASGGGGGNAISANSNLWPPRFPKFSFLRTNNERSVVSISDQAFGTYGARPFIVTNQSESSTSEGFSYAFLNKTQHHEQYINNSTSKTDFSNSNSPLPLSSSSSDITNNYQNRQQQSVSRGVVVSAVSNGQKLRLEQDTTKNSGETIEVAAYASKQQQHNLFGHLKLTLNRMLESGDNKQPFAGLVTIKALDSDFIAFDSCNSNNNNRADDEIQQQLSSSCGSLLQVPETIVEVKTNGNSLVENKQTEPASKSSTFIGNQRDLSPQHESEITSNTTVVSINVPAPKPLMMSSSNVSTSTRISESNNNNNNSGSSSKELDKFALGSNSSISSVVSLVSMSSSISNKINAAVERIGEQTTGSEISSLDSTSLFTDVPSTIRSRHKSEPRSSLADVSATVSQPPPPPPPPSPPPPSPLPIVKAGGETVELIGRLNSLPTHNANVSISSTNKEQLISKPFSSRPVDIISSSSIARRPLPQNPLHVKLRQQAAVVLSDQSNMDTLNKKSHSKQGPLLGCTIKTQANKLEAKTTSSSKKKETPSISQKVSPRPPTPPPLPNSLSTTLIVKTVSPSTSVDRGYESFQSYTSSSQHHHHHHHHHHHQQQRSVGALNPNSLQAYDLSENHNNSNSKTTRTNVSSKLGSGSVGRVLPAIPLPPCVASMQNGIHPSVTSGRQIQRYYSQQVISNQLEESSAKQCGANRQQGTTKLTAMDDSYYSGKRRRNIEDSFVSCRGSSVRVRQPAASNRTLSSSAAIFKGLPVIGRQRESLTLSNSNEVEPMADQSQQQVDKSERVAAQNRSRLHIQNQSQSLGQNTKSTRHSLVGYETEDDDFYYCYDQPSQISRSKTHQPQVNNNLLSDYACHTYKRQLPAVGNGRSNDMLQQQEFYRHTRLPGVGSIELAKAPIQGRSSTHTTKSTHGSDLMMSRQAMYQIDSVGAETHSTHHHPQHRQQQKQQQQQQQNQKQLRHHHTYMPIGQNITGKKQITWSDQVGMT